MGSLGGSSKSKSESKPLTPAQVQGYYNQLNTNSGGRLADFARNGTQPTQYTPVGAPERVTGASIDYEPLDFREQLNAPRVAPAAQANYSPVNRQVTAPKALGYGVNYTPYDYSALLQQPTVGAAAQASVSPIDAPAAVAAPTAATREVGYTELTPEQATAVGGLGALREQQARRANSQTLAQYAADPGLSTFQRLRANQLEQQDFGATLDALAQEREAAIVQLLADQRARTLQADLANQAEVNRGAQFNATQQASADQFNVGAALDASKANQSNAQAVGLTNANNSTAMTQLAAQLGMDYQSLIGGLTSTEQGRPQPGEPVQRRAAGGGEPVQRGHGTGRCAAGVRGQPGQPGRDQQCRPAAGAAWHGLRTAARRSDQYGTGPPVAGRPVQCRPAVHGGSVQREPGAVVGADRGAAAVSGGRGQCGVVRCGYAGAGGYFLRWIGVDQHVDVEG
jgi:hypothetical protein